MPTLPLTDAFCRPRQGSHQPHPHHSMIDSPGRRVVDNKHSTEIGARLRMDARTDTRRRRRRFNVGRVLILGSPRVGGEGATTVESLLSMAPVPG